MMYLLLTIYISISTMFLVKGCNITNRLDILHYKAQKDKPLYVLGLIVYSYLWPILLPLEIIYLKYNKIEFNA